MAGEKRYLGLGEEAVFGTSVAATHFMDFMRCTLDAPSEPLLRYPGAGGRSDRVIVPGAYVPSGEVEVGVDPKVFGLPLRWGLGRWVTTGVLPGGGASTTVAVAAVAGAATLTVNTEAGFNVNDVIMVSGTECVKIAALDGGGGPTYTWNLVGTLQKSHGIGEEVKEAVAPFTHAFYVTDMDALPSFTARVGKHYFEHVFEGATVGSLAFEVERGFLTARVGIVAERDSKEVLDGAAKSFPADLFSFREATATIDAASVLSKVEGFSLEVNNNLDEEGGVRHGSRFPKEFPVGEASVSGRLALAFKDQTEYDRFWGAVGAPSETDVTQYNLEVNYMCGAIPGVAPAAPYRIKFILPKGFHVRVETPVPGRERLVQQVSFAGGYDSSVSWETAVSIQLLSELFRYP